MNYVLSKDRLPSDDEWGIDENGDRYVLVADSGGFWIYGSDPSIWDAWMTPPPPPVKPGPKRFALSNVKAGLGVWRELEDGDKLRPGEIVVEEVSDA